MFNFIKTFFRKPTNEEITEKLHVEQEKLWEKIFKIEDQLKIVDPQLNIWIDHKSFEPPKYKVAGVKMREVFLKMTVKEMRQLGIDIPSDINEKAIVCLSNEAIQDMPFYWQKLNTPNTLGDLRESEIEEWSDGEEILDKINIAEARTRVFFDGESCPAYQNELHENNNFFWVPNV